MKKILILLIFSLIISACSQTIDPETQLPSDEQDLQTYTGEPQELVIQVEDLPGGYVLMEDISGEKPNDSIELLNKDGNNITGDYLETTLRIDGWENRFMLAQPTRSLPGFYLNEVVVFETSQGAFEALQWPFADEREEVEIDQQIGNAMILTEMPFTAPDGSDWIDYRVEFTYSNLMGVVSTYAPETVATPDYALDLAEILFQRFRSNLK